MVAEDGSKISEQVKEDPKESEDSESEVQEQAQHIQLEEIADLKREKATKKTAFTKVRRCLLTTIQRKEVDIQELKDICDELDIA